MPRKDKKPITSVIVVTKTLDDIAGSIFIFFNDTGTNIPKSPATIIFNTIEIDIINESVTSLNHNWTTPALIIANIIPFNIPIENSFNMFCEKLFLVNSFVRQKILTLNNLHPDIY